MVRSPDPAEFGEPSTAAGEFPRLPGPQDGSGPLSGWVPDLDDTESSTLGFRRPLSGAPERGWIADVSEIELADPMTGELLTSEALRGGRVASATGGAVGLNAIKFYFAENLRLPKWGTVDEIMADLGPAGLGVTYIRQSGLADLEWPGDDIVVADSTATSLSDVAAQLRTTLRAVQPMLADVFRRAYAANTKVTLTFLRVAAGGAWAGSTHLGSPPADPLASAGATMLADSLAFLNWGERGTTNSHGFGVDAPAYPNPDTGSTEWTIDQYLELDDATVGTIDVADEAGTGASWVWSTLDPRCPYKLRIVQEIADQWVYVLERARRDAGLGHLPLADVVAGIELCNEVNRKNILQNGSGRALPSGPKGWARLLAAAVAGFESGFSVYTDSRVPLFWPSLAEYNDDAADGTFTRSGGVLSTVEFLGTMLSDAAVELARYGLGVEAVSNLEYHVYHYLPSVGGIQVARMVDDVRRLRQLLASHGVVGEVTVSETGMPAVDSATKGSLTAEYASLYNPIFRDGDYSGVESFQAREVWRRLATHLAMGIPLVAWQTHVATDSAASNFVRTGLREDAGSDGSTDPDVATPRLAWWAYRRLVDLRIPSGYAPGEAGGGAIGAVLHPSEVGGRRPLRLARGVEDGLVILQFLDATRSEFVYVLFLDPTLTTPDSVHVLIYAEGTDEMVMVPVTVCAIAPTDPTWASAGAGAFPTPTLGWSDDVGYVNGVVYRVELDADPLILKTPYRLRFDVSSLSHLVFSKFGAQLGFDR